MRTGLTEQLIPLIFRADPWAALGGEEQTRGTPGAGEAPEEADAGDSHPRSPPLQEGGNSTQSLPRASPGRVGSKPQGAPQGPEGLRGVTSRNFSTALCCAVRACGAPGVDDQGRCPRKGALSWERGVDLEGTRGPVPPTPPGTQGSAPPDASLPMVTEAGGTRTARQGENRRAQRLF